MKRPVEFYSEGFKLQGDVYTPSDLAPGEQRGAVLLCHGYTGVKDLYLPDNARVLNDAGYVVMAFDYKGWGQSEGVSPLRLAPHSRVSDVQAAMTFLGEQPEVDEDRIGIYGTSYGGATVVWTAAIDQRAKCVVSVVGIGHGARWMSRVRRMDEWFDLLDRSRADRIQRVMTGKSDMVERGEILLPDRQSAALAAAQRANNPNAVMTIPVEYIDDTLGFNPEWVVGQISPRPVLFITSDQDRLVPPEESEQLFGPTETVLVADQGANPEFCAADLIAQAEHDPLATAILITDSSELVIRTESEIDRQLANQPRADMAREALGRQGRVVLVDDIGEAVDLANRIAPEHLCLLVSQPWEWVARVKHAGGLFLGEYSPEVMGDYVAGPSHVMPTGGTARFGSALSVHHFLRTMPVVGLSKGDFSKLGAPAVRIAEAEGLEGHANAINVRLSGLGSNKE